MKPVAIFVATRWELRALHRALPTAQASTIAGLRCLVGQRAGRTYWLIRTGIGPDAAARAAVAVMDLHAMGSAISAGFACALAPAQVGDLMVGTDVASAQLDGNWTMRSDTVQCDAVLRARVIAAAQEAGLVVKSGKIVSVPTVVEQAKDKRRLSHVSGAIALDMESSALGAVAARRGVPFAIVRTVSDLIDEDLPLDFNMFLRPTGWLNGMQVLLTHPSSLVGLNRLRKQSRMAAERLTKLFVCYAAEGYERNEVMRSS